MFSDFIRLVFKQLKFLHIDKSFPQVRCWPGEDAIASS
jgi:hypothetical protein